MHVDQARSTVIRIIQVQSPFAEYHLVSWHAVPALQDTLQIIYLTLHGCSTHQSIDHSDRLKDALDRIEQSFDSNQTKDALIDKQVSTLPPTVVFSQFEEHLRALNI